MKTSVLFLRLLALVFAILTCFSVSACTGDTGEHTEATDPGSTEPEITEAPPAEVEAVDLIADGKLLYMIVRPEGAAIPYSLASAISAKRADQNDESITRFRKPLMTLKLFISGVDATIFSPNSVAVASGDFLDARSNGNTTTV